MFSSFSKFLPTNVNITTPDFLKSVTNNANHSPEPTSSSTDAKHRNVLTKQHKSPTGDAPESHTSTLETASVNESENAHIVDNTGSKPKNESRSKRRKDATATETFYIVRPPPSKTNHPLNLQVQLLATSGRERVERRRASGSSTRSEPGANGLGLTRTTTGSRETLNDTEEGNGLKRTASIRSTRSDTESVYSAASTGSTIASVTSSSSGRRMIPLYNLHAHNVMTNSIADAGTDAKIAKFFKRGLEIMGLAVLEPVEVYGKYTWDDGWDSLYPTGRGIARTVSHMSNRSMQRAVSPSGSGIFPSNNGDLEPVNEVPSSPTTPRAPNPSADRDVGKKLFGGIFNKKKKEPPAPLPLGQTSSRDTTSTENGGLAIRSPKRHSATPSASISSPLPTVLNIPETPTTSTAAAAEVQLQPQILGLQAVLQSPMVPPKGRPSAYVWVVRRWIRGADEGFLGIGAMVESLNLGMTNAEKLAPHGGMEVEVRFEWKRCAKGKMGAPAKEREAGKDKHNRRHSIAAEGGSAVPIGVPTTHGLLDPSSAMDAASSSPSSKRLSFQGFGLGKKSPQITPPNEHSNGSHDHLKVSRAPSPNPPASITTVGTNEETTSKSAHQVIVEDDESDSDIEDSERPWNCYLHIRAPPSSRASSRDELATPLNPHSHGGDTGRSSRSNKEKTLDIRLRIAALAPAPHHPKVIAQIKTPYPLPDVLFDAHKTTAELRTRGENESLSNLAESISSANGGGGGRGAKPVVLSCEDVKDVVSCTGLWLVVREGYGGLARKRKGDGWRLRG